MAAGLMRYALAVLALALLGACGPSGAAEPAPGEPTPYNAADVEFLRSMVPHHEEGVRIAVLAERSEREEVRLLGGAIEATQVAEIETMSNQLAEWRQPATPPPDEHHRHEERPSTAPAELTSLEQATGAEFDRRFLNLMLAHQDDAIQLARQEVLAGQDPATKELASRIDRSRSAQIEQMLTLLG
ncbi:DUF305 domain-containing protein [Amycolatopsis sp. 195334CR]|uniref:DUF305 domain-containing protein n=1 Tax=Amycolatopsis sp. 195334CR TaxID=2814588 RepID=UPI001A8C0A02|nr:DUF305 domain-containing protein [Amycolatopsis sp. 195334CR]MBN6038749.1 DUF305 domain-containing protein [Amycolatopsis sp. 195334CR]